MLEKKKIASDPIINHIPWAARASAGRACGLLAGCFVALKSAGGLGMGGLGMVSKVVISVVLLSWLGSMEASGGGRKKIGTVSAFLSITVATGQMARNGMVLVQNGLGGTKLENVANLRGKGAAMLAY